MTCVSCGRTKELDLFYNETVCTVCFKTVENELNNLRIQVSNRNVLSSQNTRLTDKDIKYKKSKSIKNRPE